MEFSGTLGHIPKPCQNGRILESPITLNKNVIQAVIQELLTVLHKSKLKRRAWTVIWCGP
jgi:hypothetical protein